MMDTSCCRAVLALSNTGVSLIERGFFSEAATALKDAISLMAAKTVSLEERVEDKLRRARRRLSKSGLSLQACSHQVKVLSHSSLLEATYSRESSPFSPLCAIRIEDPDLERISTDYDLETSVLLNNLAVTNLSLYRNPDLQGSREPLREGAYRLFYMANEILMSRSVECDDDYLYFQLLQTHSVVLGNFEQLLRDCHEWVMLRSVSALLERIRATVDETLAEEALYKVPNAAAAA